MYVEILTKLIEKLKLTLWGNPRSAQRLAKESRLVAGDSLAALEEFEAFEENAKIEK